MPTRDKKRPWVLHKGEQQKLITTCCMGKGKIPYKDKLIDCPICKAKGRTHSIQNKLFK